MRTSSHSAPLDARPTSGARCGVLVIIGMLWAVGLGAQEMGKPVGADSGPLSDISRPVGEGRPVSSGRGPTLGQSSVGSMLSPPVTGSAVGSMISGPVSELSAGPMTSGRSMAIDPSNTEVSVGAVKKELASPLGERISDPLRELAPLQARLRELQEELKRPSTEVLLGQFAEEDVGEIVEESLDEGAGGTGEPGHPQPSGEEDVVEEEIVGDADAGGVGGGEMAGEAEVVEEVSDAAVSEQPAQEDTGPAADDAPPEAGHGHGATAADEEIPGEGF